MHDVKAAVRLGRPLDRVADRRDLCLDRTRLDEVGGRRTSWIAELRGVFRMYQEDRVELGDPLHALAQRPFVGGRELVDAARAHEGLESHDAALDQWPELVEVAGDEPAPQAVVDLR